MDFQALYREKLRSPEEAVKLVKDGDWVDYSQTCSFPQALDKALAARSGELHDVKIRNAISMLPVATVETIPVIPSPTMSGTAPGWTASTSTRAAPSTRRCSFATAAATTARATPRWTWP